MQRETQSFPNQEAGLRGRNTKRARGKGNEKGRADQAARPFPCVTSVRDNRTSSSLNAVWIFLFPTPLGMSYNRGMKWVDLPLEQCLLLGVFDAVSLQCLWLVAKETICSQGRNKVHNEIAYRPVAWVYNLCRILQHVVDGFYDVSLAQHHSVIERYQLVFHVCAQSCHQLYSILKEKVK